MIRDAEDAGVEAVVFPELSITAYTCADLFQQDRLLKAALEGLDKIARTTREMKIVVIVGLPLLLDNQLFDCAVVVQGGEILGIIPKTIYRVIVSFTKSAGSHRQGQPRATMLNCSAGRCLLGRICCSCHRNRTCQENSRLNFTPA